MGVLILDNFTDTNGVVLPSHTIAPTNTPGHAWANLNGTADIQSNQARMSVTFDATYGSQTVVDSGVADCTVQVAMTYDNGGTARPALCFRATDATHFFLLRQDSADLGLSLQEVTPGTFTQRGSFANTLTPGQTYTLKVVLAGTSVQCYLDGTLRISYTSSNNQTATKHGLSNYNNPLSRFDNFQVTTPVTQIMNSFRQRGGSQ